MNQSLIIVWNDIGGKKIFDYVFLNSNIDTRNGEIQQKSFILILINIGQNEHRSDFGCKFFRKNS